MIRIKNVLGLDGKRKEITLDGAQDQEIDGSHLTAIPALIDPHVHFRAPGNAHKEDWKTASRAALQSGVTHVFDMPNNHPSCVTIERLIAKKRLIDAQLEEADIPLSYGLYLGADTNHLDEISKAQGVVAGVKVFMGGSTGDLLLDSQKDLLEVCRRAKESDLIVAVHAEDEKMLQARAKQYADATDFSIHSVIRSPEVAKVAVARAIEAAAKYDTTLYLLHLSSKAELELVRTAKRNHIKVVAEATPHHLFLTTHDYAKWGACVQMNPPLRSLEDQEALWEAVQDGTIDTIGTDHAPHTLAEKQLPFGKAPSGIPGIDTYLSLLLNAVHEKKLTLARVVELTRLNGMRLFKLPENEDLVLVDLNLKRPLELQDIKTKCGWSPYIGKLLQGYPIYTIMKGRLFNLREPAQ